MSEKRALMHMTATRCRILDSGLPAENYQPDQAWRARHSFLWDLEQLPSIIERCKKESPPGPVFIVGIAANLTGSFPHFTHHVLLRARIEELTQRLNALERVTPYPYECDDEHIRALGRVVPRIERDMAAIGA